jgi:hypothetical protein
MKRRGTSHLTVPLASIQTMPRSGPTTKQKAAMYGEPSKPENPLMNAQHNLEEAKNTLRQGSYRLGLGHT